MAGSIHWLPDKRTKQIAMAKDYCPPQHRHEKYQQQKFQHYGQNHPLPTTNDQHFMICRIRNDLNDH
jgi:hypothetical protein